MSRFKDSWGKAKILLSQLLCIGAVFTACTDDEVFNQTNKALQVSVSTEAPAESRAIIDGGYLPDGASIGVTLTAEDGTAYDGQAFTNLQYTAAGEGSAQTWSSATPASLSITAGKVFAYYPYYGGDDFDLKAVPVETASQTDYMYTKPVTGINMVSPTANLTMQHAMTDIRINVKKGTYTGTGEVTKITAKAPAFATSATMDVETGVFANVSGGGAQFVQELSGAAISSGNVVHDFLIVPDAKSTSGEVSIFVIIDGKKFAVTVPYTEAFQQGFAYTYNLTLDNAALTVDGVSVTKWGVKAEVDESLKFYDDQYIVEIQVPSDGYTYLHNINGYDIDVDWGDGTEVVHFKNNKTATSNGGHNHPTHTYTKAGTYTVVTSGPINELNSYLASLIISKVIYIGKDVKLSSMRNAFESQKKLKEVSSKAFDGCTNVYSMQEAFESCTSLEIIPEGLFDKCTGVTDFESVFKGCTALETIPDGLFDHCIKATTFKSAFQSCDNLSNASAGMFDNCTKVTNFQSTFSGCKNLTTISEGLFDSCTKVTDFQWTFSGTGITEIPRGLFDKCTEVTNFQSTFNNCSSLTSIPKELFDKNIEVPNFNSTFQGCKSLISIPEGLFDYNTKVTEFNSTFRECTSLQSIPKGLFDKCTEVTDFYQTFFKTNITEIPARLFDYNTKVTDFEFTFYYCQNLQAIPTSLFDNNTLVTNFKGTFGKTGITFIPSKLFDKCPEVTTFYWTFAACEDLQAIPEGLFDYNTKVTEFYQTFSGTDIHNVSNIMIINSIPEGLFDHCTEVTNFQGTFSMNTKLQTIPEGLFDNNTKVTSFSGIFWETGITEIPEGLFDHCTEVTNFSGAFAKTGITSIPSNLFDKCTKVTNFGSTFRECSSLQTIPTGLFDYNTKVTSFYGTFEETSITSIPEGLFDNCTEVTSFSAAFYNCKSLQTIPVGLFDHCTKVTDFGGYSSSDYFLGTFSRCSNITGESPYTVINVDGQDVKVHLYERVNYPDYFTAPTRIYNCYSNCSKLTDYSSIPTDWT